MAEKNSANGRYALRIWRGCVASLMVLAVAGAWTATRELAALTEAVDGLKASMERIDKRVLYIERGEHRASR